MSKLQKPLIVCALVLLVGLFSIKSILSNLSYGIDLQGGFEILYKVSTLDGSPVTKDDLDKTYNAIVKRIDTIGVSEPVIEFEGEDLIRIQLPGVSNEEEARDRISTTAVLSFRDTDDNLLMTSDVLGSGGASLSQNSQTLYYQVALDIKDNTKFYDVTKSISSKSDNYMVIWLDYEEGDKFSDYKSTCGNGSLKCISYAQVNSALSGNVVIDGTFTKDEAQYLVDLINSGSLPTKLAEEATPRSVSASFGSSTISKTAIAGIITFVIISLILVFKYRFSGLIGSLCIFIYAVLVFGIFNAVGGVLTLTGIAALVLGIGMAVDSIIISNERIKDELLNGKTLLQAYNEGNKSSLVAIVDANITTLIAAIVLYVFGESSVRGFATMLIITIVVTILTTVLLYRLIFGMFIKSKYFNNKEKFLIGKLKEHKSFNFNKNAKYAFITSLSVLVIGVIFFLIKGFNFGVDFTGGTNINLSGKNIDFNEVSEVLSDYEVVSYDNYVGTKSEGYIKISNILDEEEELNIKSSLESLGYETSLNEISTLVTKNLTKNALKSLLYSMIAIIIYMIIRFNFNYAITGIVMLMHDVLIILSVFAISGTEVGFIIVAALLTIIGYSINDTIVVFDRIRDNRKKLFKNKKVNDKDLIDLVNISSNETINRNILTSITTIASVICLLLVNLSSIYTFNIAILIGLIAGTESSLILAPKMWLYLETKKINRPVSDDDDEVKELLIKGINS